jgi:DNA-binding IclR family transcriptional regulator
LRRRLRVARRFELPAVELHGAGVRRDDTRKNIEHRCLAGAGRLTDKTITSKAALRDELALTRERGFATDDEEHAFGLRCVASLVFDESANAIAAISISGPTARISNERIASLGKLVRRKADEITVQLGGALPEWRKAR